jgi:hypothetical protein
MLPEGVVALDIALEESSQRILVKSIEVISLAKRVERKFPIALDLVSIAPKAY